MARPNDDPHRRSVRLAGCAPLAPPGMEERAPRGSSRRAGGVRRGREAGTTVAEAGRPVWSRTFPPICNRTLTVPETPASTGTGSPGGRVAMRQVPTVSRGDQPMSIARRAVVAAAVMVAGVAGPASSAFANHGGHHLFLQKATIDAAATEVTLPSFEGVSDGQRVVFIVTESSSRSDAARRGVSYAPKLANVVGTTAVQAVTYDEEGRISFPASVDFSPERQVTPGPDGVPPAVAEPGAIGEDGYSPFIQLPDGTVLNAPHVGNDSGQADKLVSIDNDTVVFELTAGFYEDNEVSYISTEASDPVAAALENVTYAPALAAAPRKADVVDEDDAASEGLVAFTNGQLGVDNPERQGLSSALLDGLSPLNVLEEVPEPARSPEYSPLWDVHLTTWTDTVVDAGENTRQRDFEAIELLADEGLVTGFGGGAFAPSGFFVNCPVISEVRGRRATPPGAGG